MLNCTEVSLISQLLRMFRLLFLIFIGYLLNRYFEICPLKVFLYWIGPRLFVRLMLYVTVNNISVIDMMAHKCAGD